MSTTLTDVLDVEGSEYLVMKGFNFSEYTFLLLSVERPKVKLHKLLTQKLYISYYPATLLIELGRKLKSLKLDHVPSLSDGDSSKVLSGQFNAILQVMSEGGSSLSSRYAAKNSDANQRSLMNRHSLMRKLFLLIWKDWAQQAFFQLIESLSMFLSPLALNTILLYVKYQGNEQYMQESFVSISIITAVAFQFLAPFLRSIGGCGNYLRGRYGITAVVVLLIPINQPLDTLVFALKAL